MKKTTKRFGIAILTMLPVFLVSGCAYDIEVKGESPYLGNTLSVNGQQMWEQNHVAVKINQTYRHYEESHDIDVLVISRQSEVPLYEYGYVGRGIIINGVLSFTVDSNITKTKLLNWDELCVFFDFWDFWENSKISPSDAKVNIIQFITYPPNQDTNDGFLNRQRITGTRSSVSCETIFYLYADKPCKITGKSSSGHKNGYYDYVTGGDLNLSLKEGWNMVTQTETYGSSFNGNAKFSIKLNNPIENPDSLKWVKF